VILQKPREIAARALKRHRTGQQYIERLLEQELGALAPEDRGLCQELVYGIVRWQKTLDWLIARKTGGREQNPQIHILLQLGLYQLFWLERVPDHAAVHETVEMAKKFGFQPQAGFINAVLRGYTRERDQTKAALEQLKQTDLAIGYSHPEWLVERWIQRWGKEKTIALLQWNNSPPPTFARVNTLKADTRKLKQVWDSENVSYRPVERDWIPNDEVFELESHPSLATLRTFQEGMFYVQDPSTLLAVAALDPKAGEHILDVCSAPGGKTTYIAQRMNDKGEVLAEDNQPERLKLVVENCERLGVTCVGTTSATQQFDRILIDAPCSNTGVLRRRVDLRWRIKPEEITRLRDMQLAILRDSVKRLKPGGTLVYSTCSLEPEENLEVIKMFVEENPQFTLENERQLLPFEAKVDGAYVATLKLRA
jgi:16S rRNA (cytosine967-C5)-methyltransferase